MNRDYNEIISDLKRGLCTPALANRAARAIQELITTHELDQSLIVELRNQIKELKDRLPDDT